MGNLTSVRDVALRHGTAAATVGALGVIAALMMVPGAPSRSGGDAVRTFVWECHAPGTTSGAAPLELVRTISGDDSAR